MTTQPSRRNKPVTDADVKAPGKSLLKPVAASNEDARDLLTPPASAVDLDRYVPAYFVWIANKLTRGASQNYLNLFGVGAEVWRCMVLLAIHETISAQQISQVIGMDKASVSRCFKQMVAKKLIALELDPADGRIRLASLTLHGRHIHDQILGIALARERALLEVLSKDDHETLLRLLKRLHENLPAVEVATQAFIADSLAKPVRRRNLPPSKA
ncbi:MAG: MarR family winged helix-turn-helix transcriptional regulator [Polaromonas sp.]|uniref:MarR family winged helix-turn-helix transcriptional regulator n=1 Tax=Polaromonas sp. TaxID=1869339 RepID=UPI0027337F1E|nr:MarR family winged helix-turn-helix transcriptional regulator [Polaromonas sp.]MDP2818106.1 MarR family winged helix-turn-helix transcriptional regulator [Polaromonas sp.]